MMKTLFAQVEGFIFALVLLWAGLATLISAGLIIGLKDNADEILKVLKEENQ